MDLNGDGVTIGLETLLVNVVALSVVIGAVGVIWKKVFKPMIRSTFSMVRRTNKFLDDWYGDDVIPGVVQRIASLESDRTDTTSTLAVMLKEIESIKSKVSHELNHNGGSSTKDAAFEALRIVQGVQLQQEQEVQERKYLTAQLERILNVRIETENP